VDLVLKKFKKDGHRSILMKAGTIFFRDSSVGCVVLNISTGGAGLVVEGDIALPYAFDLAIEGDPSRRRCLAAWRIDRRIGVTFELEQ
jgi:hypothetical protein